MTIVANDGTDGVIGIFSPFAEGSAVTAGGHKFQISYLGGTGNDVTLTEKLDQSISFSSLSDKTFGGGTFGVSASATSGLAVGFSSTTPSVCAVSVTTVSLVGAGQCTIAADQSGSVSYFAAPQIPQSFNVAKAAQSITFGALVNKTFGDPAFSLSATGGGSGNAVTFLSTTTGVCTVSSTTVTIVGVGTCAITADQAGDGNYNAASQVPQSFMVGKGSQTITFNALGDKTLGDPAFTVSATGGGSGNAVIFSSTTTSVCTVSTATVTLVASGLCTVAANQAGSANYNAAPQVTQSFAVNVASVPRMAVELPAGARLVPVLAPFDVQGWALDLGAGAGAGVDAVQVWAFPFVNGAPGAPIFLGPATTGIARSDIAAAFGAQFANAGWALHAPGLAAGQYMLSVYARSSVTGTFNNYQSNFVTAQALTPDPVIQLDVPHAFATFGGAVLVSGWAVDGAAPTGPGIDAVHVWAYPIVGNSLGTPIFLGAATQGLTRSDVAAIFGVSFGASGFSLQATGLAPGAYRIVADARSTVSGTFTASTPVDVTVASGAVPNPFMSLETPSAGASRTQPFLAAGWALDFGASVGPGVDAVHVWATRVSDGTSTFLGAASYGAARSDIGATFGSSFSASGFSLSVSGLAAGTYDITVFARSTVTGTFNQMQTVRVGVQ
jgi:hypothetical protein